MIFSRIVWVITFYSSRQRKQAEVAAFSTEEPEDCAT